MNIPVNSENSTACQAHAYDTPSDDGSIQKAPQEVHERATGIALSRGPGCATNGDAPVRTPPPAGQPSQAGMSNEASTEGAGRDTL